jgi:hypothetical protein
MKIVHGRFPPRSCANVGSPFFVLLVLSSRILLYFEPLVGSSAAEAEGRVCRLLEGKSIGTTSSSKYQSRFHSG